MKTIISAILFSTTCVFPSFAGQTPIAITLGLGATHEEITKKSPALASYFDTPSVNEPGMRVDGSLAYKDKKHNFIVRNLQLLRLRGDSGVFEIRAELRPNFKDVPELVHHFNEFKAEVTTAIKGMDASGMPRLHDSSIKHDTKLDDHIFTVDNLLFDLKTTQLTDEHRNRCGGHYEWLLGAWADEEIFALLVLTGMQNEFEVIGENFGTDHGYRLAIIITPNEYDQTAKVREANWRAIFYPTDQLRLPLVNRSECYNESASLSMKQDLLKRSP